MRLYFSGSDHVNPTVQLAATPQMCGHVLALWSLALWSLALWSLALWSLALWSLALWSLALWSLALVGSTPIGSLVIEVVSQAARPALGAGPRRVRLPGSRHHRSLANPLCPSRL